MLFSACCWLCSSVPAVGYALDCATCALLRRETSLSLCSAEWASGESSGRRRSSPLPLCFLQQSGVASLLYTTSASGCDSFFCSLLSDVASCGEQGPAEEGQLSVHGKAPRSSLVWSRERYSAGWTSGRWKICQVVGASPMDHHGVRDLQHRSAQMLRVQGFRRTMATSCFFQKFALSKCLPNLTDHWMP